MLRFTKFKTLIILLTCFFGTYLTVPNFVSKEKIKAINSYFKIMPTNTIVLGLDLQGGAHVAFEVDRAELIKNQVSELRDDVRRILREQQTVSAGGIVVQQRSVQIKIADPQQLAKVLPKLQELARPVANSTSNENSLLVNSAQDGAINIAITDAGLAEKIKNAVEKARQVFEKRINPDGTLEASVQRQGAERILIQAPGLTAERIEAAVGGVAKLEFRMVANPGAEPTEVDSMPYSEGDGRISVEKRILVQGEDLIGADSGFVNSEPVINFKFNQRGAAQFARATSENIGRPFAIILDGKVISAPSISVPITGGQGYIHGNFTLESATNLATQLRFGALPAKFSVVERRSVGAGLGQDAIEAGKLAAFIASASVIIFTIISYGILGVIAVLALIVNVILIFGIMSLLGATLTLPGIAGIVLTVGIAVDSNVLVYERVREEKRLGRSTLQALDAGFSRAFATIVDANVTTFISGLVLFIVGSGTVKGFAVTLCLGILTTVFTAFTLTRLFTAWWYKWFKPKTVLEKLLRIIPDDTKYPFMRWREWSFPFSALISIISVAAFFALGMNVGIDFKGGSLFEMQAKAEKADIPAMRAKLSTLNIGGVEIQAFGSDRDVLVQVELQKDGEIGQKRVVETISQAFNADYIIRRTETVGPRVSSELVRDGTIGILMALVCITIYLWFRFEWQFAVGAMIATMHDLVLTIGFYAIVRLHFDQTSIAAILTMIGYSLNDTVVIYDRIREMMRKYKKISTSDLMDIAVNATLSRSVVTHITVFLALCGLLLGGEVIRGFSLAMLFGVVIGTYSSVFIAAPILIYLGVKTGERQGDDDTANKRAKAQ